MMVHAATNRMAIAGLRPLRDRAGRRLGERARVIAGPDGWLLAGAARARARRCSSPTSISRPRATRRWGRATTRFADRRPALY